MRIRADQLSQHLSKALSALYCVYGDEPLLSLEACDSIRRHALRAGYTQREIFHVEARFDWNNLLDSGRHLSLFAEQRIVELRIPTGKPGTEGARALLQYCARLPADTITVISLPKIDKASSNSKWFTGLEGAGIMVPILPITVEQLPRWIAERLALQQQRTSTQALNFITEKVEGNLLAAQQEVLKLGLLYPTGELSLTQVQDAILDVARYDVFKLSDAILVGDVQRIIRIVRGLKNEGEALTLLLWAITRELRLLKPLAGLSGDKLRQGMRAGGIWENRQGLTERAAHRLSSPKIDHAMQQATHIDRMIKGLDNSEPWLAIEKLCVSLC